MKTTLWILSLASLVILFTNCSTPRYAYNQTAHNVPHLSQKGDSKLAAYYSNNAAGSSSDDNGSQYDKATSQGFDVQGAVAVTNNIAVQADYYYRGEKSTSTSSSSSNFAKSVVDYKRNMFVIGAGYFTPVDKNKKVFVQVFGGVGFGKTNIKDKGVDQSQANYSRFYDVNLTKFYLEPSISFRHKEIFSATVATRASVIKFRNIKTDYSLFERQDFNLDSLDRFAVAFFEPSFIGSFGFPKAPGVRVEFQVGLSVLWEEDFIDYRPFNFSVGLAFDIGKLIRGSARKTDE